MPPRKIREEVIGKATVRLVHDGKSYLGVVIQGGKVSDPISGDDADKLWQRLRNEVGKVSPQYFGYDGARARFLRIMKSGFQSDWYQREERRYKVDAKVYLDDHLSLDRAQSATKEDAIVASRAYAKTNLLSQFEQARVHEILTGVEGPDFVRAAADLCLGEVKSGLFVLNRILASHGQPSWPAATYLPFFWRLESNMFLKPKVTCDFAERVGHRFAHEYSPRLEAQVYESLLDLASEAETAIADMKPLDRIDLQSFIWVVGAYTEEDEKIVQSES